MSRFTDALVQSQQISAAAKEEASRWRHPRIDVEHLLLALLVTPGAAGRLLRSLGVTLDAGRAAVEAVHSERLARLGVQAVAAPASPALDPASGVTRWSPGAEAVMRSVDEHADDLGYLRAIATEPSGLVADVLRQLGLDSPSLIAEVDRLRAEHPSRSDQEVTGRRGWDTVVHVDFVPAPREEVWELLRDPGRLPEWDHLVRRVESSGADEWTVWRTHAHADKSPRQRRLGEEGYRLQIHDVRRGRGVTWRSSFASSPRDARREVDFELDDATGGTSVTATSRWRRPSGWRAVVSAPLRPLRRFLMRQQLVASTGGLSRALR